MTVSGIFYLKMSVALLLLLWFLAGASAQTVEGLSSGQSEPSQDGLKDGQSVELHVDPPPSQLSPALQLSLEQIEDLILSGEYSEAIQNLEKLFDQTSGQLVARGGQQHAGTLSAQSFQPVRRWVKLRLASLLRAQPELNTRYQLENRANAKIALARLNQSKNIVRGRESAERYSATLVGAQFSAVLADLYLERGWGLAAVAEAEKLSSDLRVSLGDGSKCGLPWPLVYAGMKTSTRENVSAWFKRSEPATESEARLVEAMRRVFRAAQICPNEVDMRGWSDWWQQTREQIPENLWNQDPMLSAPEDLKELTTGTRADWTTFAAQNSRDAVCSEQVFGASVRWSQTLPLYMASSDEVPASKPRASESEQGTLPYHPVVVDEKVYVNTMTQILAFDLNSGKSWPSSQSGKPLFDSHIAPGAFLPLGYPLMGVPRGTLTVDASRLYARMGEPVSGWANKRRSLEGGSVSYLIGLDLERQGSMLSGFPLHLNPPDFGNSEFDGPPIVFGELLIAPVVERDNVGLRRSVVAFDSKTGRLAWRSPVLASGLPEGSGRANLITHQLLTLAGGRLFYNTNLGSIVCLDPLLGEVLWLTQYSRDVLQPNAFPQPDRFRYRDRNPCLVHRGLVYCAPQDCAEVFALEPSSGDLVWSTSEEQLSDCVHLLGAYEDSLILSGDRVAWVDRRTGRLQARFPGSTTPGVLNALPNPRGLGRGIVAGSKVYWPVAGEILVFAASPPEPTGDVSLGGIPIQFPKIVLGARGRDGGNIVAAGDRVIYASSSRVMALE